MSRQSKAYDGLLDTFFKLIDRTKDIPEKETLKVELHEIFDYPVVRENLTQSFSNFMWEEDKRHDEENIVELEQVMGMIPSWADPNDKNTIAILQNIRLIVASARTPLDELSDVAIDALVQDDETDDSRPQGL